MTAIRGRNNFNSSPRPASADPWCATFRISTGGSWRCPLTSDSASAVNSASVWPYEATSTIAWLFGSSPGEPGPSGHRTRIRSWPILNPSPARATTILTPCPRAAARAARSSGLSPGPRGRRSSSTLFRALARNRRVEHGAHAELLQHLLGAAYVIPLGVRQHDEREALHSEPPQL